MTENETRKVRSHTWTPETKSGVEVWLPPGPKVKDPLDPLLERAARALKLEDERIRQALASSTVPKAYERCGHGLSYWVFEHNLLLPIFLDWAKTHVVRWDEPECSNIRKPSGVSTDADALERADSEDSNYRLVDLQLALSASDGVPNGQIVRLEAKWWVLKRSAIDVAKDVKKLRDMKGAGERAVLLTFWYGVNDEFGKDMEAANRPKDTKPLMAAVFDTTVYPWWWGKEKESERKLMDGYFAMVAFELTS